MSIYKKKPEYAHGKRITNFCLNVKTWGESSNNFSSIIFAVALSKSVKVGRHIILNDQLPKPILESGKFGHHGQSIKIGQQIISVKVVMKKNAEF